MDRSSQRAQKRQIPMPDELKAKRARTLKGEEVRSRSWPPIDASQTQLGLDSHVPHSLEGKYVVDGTLLKGLKEVVHSLASSEVASFKLSASMEKDRSASASASASAADDSAGSAEPGGSAPHAARQAAAVEMEPTFAEILAGMKRATASYEQRFAALREDVTTLKRHVGFMWTATLTNGFFGHVSRVLNQTRLIFSIHVAAAVGRKLAPVTGDPGTPGTWVKGTVLVPLRRDISSATKPVVPVPELTRLFETVTKTDKGIDITEEMGGVFGFRLVLNANRRVSKLLRDHRKARDDRKANKKLRDPDASNASQPLLQGLDIQDSVTANFAKNFGLAKQAEFLNCFNKKRNIFAHGDDDTAVRWGSGSADAFASRVLEKIRALRNVARRLDRTEGTAAMESASSSASASASASASDAHEAVSTECDNVCVHKTADGSWKERKDDNVLSIDNIASLLEWADDTVSFLRRISDASDGDSARGF
jgi:hypothetical protein